MENIKLEINKDALESCGNVELLKLRAYFDSTSENRWGPRGLDNQATITPANKAILDACILAKKTIDGIIFDRFFLSIEKK